MTAMDKMKLGKSPGSDGLPLEFYLHFGTQVHECPLIEFLHMVLLESYQQQLLPQSMRRIQLRLLFKKTTDAERLLPKNYRPIALLPAVARLAERLFNHQLKRHAQENGLLPDSQHGFRAGHSGTSALLLFSPERPSNARRAGLPICRLGIAR